MAKQIEIEHLSEGWREILNSAAVQSLCDEVGAQIAAKAGEGFVYTPQTLGYGGGRAGGFVTATTYEAMLAEAQDKALSSAVW